MVSEEQARCEQAKGRVKDSRDKRWERCVLQCEVGRGLPGQLPRGPGGARRSSSTATTPARRRCSTGVATSEESLSGTRGSLRTRFAKSRVQHRAFCARAVSLGRVTRSKKRGAGPESLGGGRRASAPDPTVRPHFAAAKPRTEECGFQRV